MFINPQLAVTNGAITGLVDPAKQIQPNAIDFTLDKLFMLDQNVVTISEKEKAFRTSHPVELEDGNWVLEGGRVYDGLSDVFVKVPKGAAAILFSRSTFVRNGVFIVSGLYDSGFEGHIGFTIYTLGGPVTIGKGTRIGQIALISADAAGSYAGGYNHAQGTVAPSTAPSALKPGEGVNVGQRFIPSDPRRTETGMGPLVDAGKSSFV